MRLDSPIQPTIHKDATARTLAAARVFILLCWIIKFLAMDLAALGYLPFELFHPFGLMQLVPESILQWLTLPRSLTILQASILLVLVASVFGIGGKKTLAVAVALITLCFGLTKGFGGHVNHRELVLLYATFLMLAMPVFDAFAWRRTIKPADTRIYASSMQMLAALILFSYFFVGLARVCVGMPTVFDPQVMYDWVLSRNVRPNPRGWTVGLTLLSGEAGRWMLALALPFSTVVELFAPVCLWSGRTVRRVIVTMLILFHLGILLLMNIAFFENIALLLLLYHYTPWLNRRWADDRRQSSSSLAGIGS